MGWFATTRAILELVYFVSGIIIAVAAVLALSQIRLTKQIARANSRRESVKLAADLCKYFADPVVPLWGKADDDCAKAGVKCLTVTAVPGQPTFLIKDGEIVNHQFNLRQLIDDSPKLNSAVTYLNALEAFAIPFAAGVADEDIGYRETARPFLQGVQTYMPVIYHLRITNRGRFESIIRLYATWSKRLAADVNAPIVKALQDLVRDATKDRIKPLDEF